MQTPMLEVSDMGSNPWLKEKKGKGKKKKKAALEHEFSFLVMQPHYTDIWHGMEQWSAISLRIASKNPKLKKPLLTEISILLKKKNWFQ